MNGTPDPNYPEAGNAGAYTGTARESAAGGAYTSGANAGSYGAAYTGPAPDPFAPGYVPPPPPGYAPPYGYPAPPPVPGSPNPGLAVLLGFIPGVGAMYNGQFAKGIVHIVIFAVLTKVAEHVDVFGLFVAGWIFYMVFDAYQTARARRDGLVPPDPFGLNNVGERFGVPGNPSWGDFMARPPVPGTQATNTGTTSNPYAGPPVDPATGAPVPGYSYAAPNVGGFPGGGNPYGPAVPPSSYPPGPMPSAWNPAYPDAVHREAVAGMGGAPTAGYQATYTPVDPAGMPPFPPQPASGIPTGAIWLIGLGVLALAGSLAHNSYWRGYFFGAVTCFIFGIILLVQQTSVTRKLYPRGTAAYQWSLLHQARFGLIVIVVGVLQIIAGTGLTSWHYLWPYMLILFGLLQLADRALYNRMLLDPPIFPNSYPHVNPAPDTTGSYAASTVTASSGSTSTGTAAEEVR